MLRHRLLIEGATSQLIQPWFKPQRMGDSLLGWLLELPFVQLGEERTRVDWSNWAFHAVRVLSLFLFRWDAFLGLFAVVRQVDHLLLFGLYFVGPIFGIFLRICFKLLQFLVICVNLCQGAKQKEGVKGFQWESEDTYRSQWRTKGLNRARWRHKESLLAISSNRETQGAIFSYMYL